MPICPIKKMITLCRLKGAKNTFGAPKGLLDRTYNKINVREVIALGREGIYEYQLRVSIKPNFKQAIMSVDVDLLREEPFGKALFKENKFCRFLSFMVGNGSSRSEIFDIFGRKSTTEVLTRIAIERSDFIDMIMLFNNKVIGEHSDSANILHSLLPYEFQYPLSFRWEN